MATLCTSGAVKFKAGKNKLAAISGAYYEYAINAAESYICSETRYNWMDAYAGLNADVKYILEEVSSNLAAMYIINYDMSGYTSRTEAQTMLDILNNGAVRGINTLKDIKNQDFMNNA